jgi:hypothetical protein
VSEKEIEREGERYREKKKKKSTSQEPLACHQDGKIERQIYSNVKETEKQRER